MDLLNLALMVGAGTIGSLAAAIPRLRVPVVVGEILIGVLLGKTGINAIHPNAPLISGLATMGFATVMLVAGSHVPVSDKSLRGAAPKAAALVVTTAVAAAAVGLVVAKVFGTHHGALYAVLMSSTSAAMVLPILVENGLSALTGTDPQRPGVLTLMTQAAIADTACIVALPLVANPNKALSAALGSLGLAVGAALLLLLAHYAGRRGWLQVFGKVSIERNLGLQLRISLIVLLVLAGLASKVGSSTMLAGFLCGLVLAALGEPRRLATQLFALSDGFLAPIFFVRLGSTLDLRAVFTHGKLLGLGIALGVAAVAVHVIAGLLYKERPPFAMLAAAQLGVPVAAVTLGQSSGSMSAGEAGAIILAALITIGGTIVANAMLGPSTMRPGEKEAAA